MIGHISTYDGVLVAVQNLEQFEATKPVNPFKKSISNPSSSRSNDKGKGRAFNETRPPKPPQTESFKTEPKKTCFHCKKAGHYANDCPARKTLALDEVHGPITEDEGYEDEDELEEEEEEEE
jgi:hypothetical protein